MSGNSIGKHLILTSFGESHGPAIGGVIDGFPPRIEIDTGFIQSELNRRKPGQSGITTPRIEEDALEILSGVFEGFSTGAPIGFLVRNTGQLSADYNKFRDLYRPSHADFTYEKKYAIRDHRGGGRASARETIARVVGGAFAKLYLNQFGITIQAYTRSIGHISIGDDQDVDPGIAESNILRCPDQKAAAEMENYLMLLKGEGETVGGVVSCIIKGIPPGLGNPVFNKLQASLAAAMMSINAAKGFEYGLGFKSSQMKGSDHNDVPVNKGNQDVSGFSFPVTNKAGGILGGISTGHDIYFNVAFKPPSTLLKDQVYISKSGEKVAVKPSGRFDPCILPRVVPVVEAMAALVIADHHLQL